MGRGGYISRRKGWRTEGWRLRFVIVPSPPISCKPLAVAARVAFLESEKDLFDNCMNMDHRPQRERSRFPIVPFRQLEEEWEHFVANPDEQFTTRPEWRNPSTRFVRRFPGEPRPVHLSRVGCRWATDWRLTADASPPTFIGALPTAAPWEGAGTPIHRLVRRLVKVGFV